MLDHTPCSQNMHHLITLFWIDSFPFFLYINNQIQGWITLHVYKTSRWLAINSYSMYKMFTFFSKFANVNGGTFSKTLIQQKIYQAKIIISVPKVCMNIAFRP